jgi:hypothetical protein
LEKEVHTVGKTATQTTVKRLFDWEKRIGAAKQTKVPSNKNVIDCKATFASRSHRFYCKIEPTEVQP